MKSLKRMLLLTTLVCMLPLKVLADNHTYEDVKKLDGNQIALNDEKTSKIFDNSELSVKVIKSDKKGSNVIYTGKLSEYDNGMWMQYDFRNTQFFVIFDWDSAEDEAIYIIPIDENKDVEQKETESLPDKEEVKKGIELNSEINSDSQNEKTLTNRSGGNIDYVDYEMTYTITTINEQTNMNVNCNIYNSGTDGIEPVIIAGIYDNGVLRNLQLQPVIVPGGASRIGNIVLQLPDENRNRYSVKLMLWESMGTLKPLGEAKTIDDIEGYLREKFVFVNTTANEEIRLFMNSENTIGNNINAVHTISYDTSRFLPIDLCGFTYEKELSPMIVDNADVEIIEADFTAGVIKYRFSSNEGRNTGINNFIKLKALTTADNQEITYTIW